jgi:cytochrome b
VDRTQGQERVAVWDVPVRVLHWLLVFLLVALIATGLAGDDWLVWHMRAGAATLTLVVFRILWGFAGSANARFSAFVRGPSAVIRYARSLLRPPHEMHATHNPIGGWMTVLLLAVLLVQCLLGLCTADEDQYAGPLVAHISDALAGALSHWHRRVWWAVAALAVVHIGAVAGYDLRFRDNLAAAMLSGAKELPSGVASERGATMSWPLALVLFAACAGASWWLFNRY